MTVALTFAAAGLVALLHRATHVPDARFHDIETRV
jgi:hypothetical protein